MLPRFTTEEKRQLLKRRDAKVNIRLFDRNDLIETNLPPAPAPSPVLDKTPR